MNKPIRWGILGTGKIANTFTQALKTLPQAEIKAVGSRNKHKALTFAKTYNIPNAYASYEELVQDRDVDIIYVSTPHSLHKENTLLALEADKHVLCEKPLALNSQEIDVMINTAVKRNLFLMEAMWMWFFPALQDVKKRIDRGDLGELRQLTADFGFFLKFDPKHRLFNPDLGGGALLDIGIYPLALAFYLLGKPEKTTSQAILGKSGVDEQIHLLLNYPGEKNAVLNASVRAGLPNEAVISGSKGFIRICQEFWHPEKITVSLTRGKEESFTFPQAVNGMEYEAQHVMDCLLSGKTESDVMPHQASRDLMAIMDDLRQSWGVRYPGE